MVHGIGLCDEWPAIRYPNDGGERSGTFQNGSITTLNTSSQLHIGLSSSFFETGLNK